jgi:hypothetical protein
MVTALGETRCIAQRIEGQCAEPAKFVRLCLHHFLRQRTLLKEGRTLVFVAPPDFDLGLEWVIEE